MKLSRKTAPVAKKTFKPTQVLINPNKPCIRVYTDGSCLVNPGGAGTYSFVLVEDNVAIYEYGEHYQSTTNNRMEIMAVMNAVQYIVNQEILDQVVIYMDSTYVYTSIQKKAGKQANKNGDLLEKLRILVQDNPHIQYMWTKGHAGQKWNEYADNLCRTMYKKTAIPDTGYTLATTNTIEVKIPTSHAKEYLLRRYLPNILPEDREVWYKCSDWARTVVQIMEEYKQIS